MNILNTDPNYYRLKQDQIDNLFRIISKLPFELVEQAQTLETRHSMNLISAQTTDVVKAALMNRAKKTILFDTSYQAEQYKRLLQSLAEYQTPPNDPDGSQERAEKQSISESMNRFFDEYLFNNYSDLLTWVKEKQPLLCDVQSNFKTAYASYIGWKKGGTLDRMNYDHLARLTVKKRKAYLQNFQMKRVKPRVQELYGSISTLQAVMNEYKFDTNFLLALVHNFINPSDKALSIQKLDNLFLEMEDEKRERQQ